MGLTWKRLQRGVTSTQVRRNFKKSYPSGARGSATVVSCSKPARWATHRPGRCGIRCPKKLLEGEHLCCCSVQLAALRHRGAVLGRTASQRDVADEARNKPGRRAAIVCGCCTRDSRNYTISAGALHHAACVRAVSRDFGQYSVGACGPSKYRTATSRRYTPTCCQAHSNTSGLALLLPMPGAQPARSPEPCPW